MSIAKINDCHYTDGGVLIQVPIKQAILDGCDEIDIIILNKEGNNWTIEHIRNFFHYQIKLLLLMMNKLMDHQIDLGYLSHHANKLVKLNFHYTTKRLTNNYFHVCSNCDSKRFAQKKGVEKKQIWNVSASSDLPIGRL